MTVSSGASTAPSLSELRTGVEPLAAGCGSDALAVVGLGFGTKFMPGECCCPCSTHGLQSDAMALITSKCG